MSKRIVLRSKVLLQRRQHLRRLAGRTLLVGASAIAGVWCAPRASEFFLHSPYFSIREISVEGNAVLSSDGLRRACGIRLGENLFLCSTRTAEKRLKAAFARLNRLRVSRRLLGGIHLRVEERKPLARRRSTGASWEAVDAEGIFFPAAPSEKNLPALASSAGEEETRACVSFLSNFPPRFSHLKAQIRWLTAIRGDVTFALSTGEKIRFGEVSPDLFEMKISHLDAVLSDLAHKGRRVRLLNLQDFSPENKSIAVRS